MTGRRAAWAAGLVALAAVPAIPLGATQEYIWHVTIRSSCGPSLAMPGRSWAFRSGVARPRGILGVEGLRRRDFVELLWDHPVAGRAGGIALTVVFALIVAYPCSRFQVIGHYFGLVTLAVGEVVRLLIVAERD